ncbi:MAG: hypothetical protein RLZZ244_852 [Verrucomicrobiota bacterium]
MPPVSRCLPLLVAFLFSVPMPLPASAPEGPGFWPQAAGPRADWTSDSKDAPVSWSVALNQNIAWKTTLPETGQSGIAVWGNRLFLTTMKPLEPDSKKRTGSAVVGYCLDADSGSILWTVELPGVEESTYAYGFSDSSSPTPVTDGEHVWFFNASGSVGCWDYAGKPVWLRTWTPTKGRPFNKQFEPMLAGDTLLNMEPRDEGDPKREQDPWNYLRGLDKRTGRTLWVSDDALTHYNTPGLGVLPDGMRVVLQGRGGHHGVPEAPVGMSATSLMPGEEGRTVWRYEGEGRALYTMQMDGRYAYWWNESDRVEVLDSSTGKRVRTLSLSERVDLRRFRPESGRYELEEGVALAQVLPEQKVFPAWFTNVRCGNFLYFLCFSERKYGPAHCVGRVHGESGKVEYLEVPVQVVRHPGEAESRIWGEPQASSTVNARGIDVAGDKRSKRDGWYWCMLGNPTVLGGRVYFTTMLGVTYVLDGLAPVLDEKALLSVNDLGKAGETWSLNTLSGAGDRLYHRSMREVVCIRNQPSAGRP